MGTNESHPFSHFYSLAYMAARYEQLNKPEETKCQDYLETAYGVTAQPVGTNGWPKYKNYWGYVTIASGANQFAQANIFLWPYYIAKGLNQNPYYQNTMLKNVIKQDRLFADKSYTYNGYIKTFWEKFITSWNVPGQEIKVDIYQTVFPVCTDPKTLEFTAI